MIVKSKFSMAVLFILFISLFSCNYVEYNYVEDTPWLTELEKIKGIKELPGDKVNPVILEAFKLCGLPEEYWDDNKTGWCSAVTNLVFQRAGFKGTMDARGKSWENYGAPIKKLVVGTICVFKLPNGQYHVSILKDTQLYKMKDDYYIKCLGANQSNTIRESFYKYKDLIAKRFPTEDLRL